MKVTASQREAIRLMFGGRCAYCGCELPTNGWHIDHVEPVMRDSRWVRGENGRAGKYVSGKMLIPDRDRIDNLFPACRPCNIDKGPNSLEGWRDYLSDRITQGLRRNSSTFRHAERFGMVTITKEPLVFWFERYDIGEEEEENEWNV